MNEFVIREARAEDALELLGYLKQIGAETDNLTFGAEGLPFTVEEEEKHIRTVQEDPRSVMFVAVKDGKIVGDASLSSMPRRMKHRAELGVTVVKDQWNQGIGSALMQKLISYAKGSGIEVLNLDVRADNAKAIHLYEKFGFQPIGLFPAFLKIQEKYVDVLLMYLDLR